MAKNHEKCAYLNRLSTEQLMELLRADFASSESGQEDVVFHILEVLEKREDSEAAHFDVDRARTEFQQYYDIPEGEGEFLYPCRVDAEKCEGFQSEVQPLVAKRKFMLINHRVTVAAAVIILVGMLVAQAAGIDVFSAIGRWTDDLFQFNVIQEGGNNSSTEIQELLANSKMDERLVPTWIPEGFVASEPVISDTVVNHSVDIEYKNETGRYFYISIRKYYSTDFLRNYVFEKDRSEVEEYKHGTMTFYIMKNLEVTTAVWSDGIYVIEISGTVPVEEIKSIVDSIKEMAT